MVRLSVWPTSNANNDFSHSIDAWRQDPELLSSFGECFRIRPAYARGARMFHKTVPFGELSISATSSSSPLVHDCVPAAAESARRFFLLMPNKPRYLDIADQRFVQQSGECAIADSTVAHTASYLHPHASICLSVPDATLRDYVPEPDRLVGMRFTPDGTLSRLVSTLLLSVWASAERGAERGDELKATSALLRVVACCYARSSVDADAAAKVNCQQVKKFIGIEIRNPALSVQFVAERIGVTTRYLQLLFAEEQECVSQYIKRERLLGCLLDLRDGDFDHQSITEIAFSWGFNSAAHFSSSFKKEFGLNPRDYRACNREELEALGATGEEGALIQAVLQLGRHLRH
jgi:AraC-like DNA-binding protein